MTRESITKTFLCNHFKIEKVMRLNLNAPILAVTASLLCGCVSMSTMMVNQEGKWVRCQATGAGWLGAPMAANNHSRCVDDLARVGYVPLSEATWGVKLVDWSASPVKIDSVLPGSSAEAAGLKAGDVVKMVDGKPIAKGIDVFKAISDKKPGDTLRVQVERDGSPIETSGVLGARK